MNDPPKGSIGGFAGERSRATFRAPGTGPAGRFTKAFAYARSPASFVGETESPAASECNPNARKKGSNLQVTVRDNNVDQALRALKKKMQREGIFREMKMRRNYEKPSEKRAREKAESIRRHRKMLRKRLEREGF